jgi:hypothetical protein
MAELNFDVPLGDTPQEKPNTHYPSFGSNTTAGHKDSGSQEVALNINPPAANTSTQPPSNQSKVPLCGFFTVEYYQPYFNVQTTDVQERIKSSLNPLKPRFFELTQENPDLYGPIWIYTTLVLVLAAAGNFAQFLHPNADKTVSYNYNFVPTAAMIIYGYGFIFPLILTVLLKVFGSNSTSYIQTICCYGYSLFVFIPAFVLSIIPVSILQWVLIILAIVSSTLFLVTNYGHELKKYVGKQRYILIGFIGAAQIILLLIFKLYFFASIYNDKPLDTTPDV